MQLAAISGVTETIARNDAIVSGEPHLAQAEVFAPAPDAALDLESR